MKALSIKNPWATLIAHGIKDIENRTWRTKFKGRIYIHVSSPKKFHVELTDPQMIQALPLIPLFTDGKVSFGAIIGEVDIIDCVQNHQSIWAEKAAHGEKPIWNWVLENAVLYDHQIENVKGALSLWEYTKYCPSCKKEQLASYFSKGDDECVGCLYLPY
jgi:hypothetical protein